MTGDPAADALGFAFLEAVEAGTLDDHVSTLIAALTRRAVLRRSDNPPARTEQMIHAHQVWVWMNGVNRWELRGTGLVFD